MSAHPESRIITLPGLAAPSIDPAAWVAPGAVIAGPVVLSADASAWYGAVLRAEAERIVIGPESNIQDNVSAHVDAGAPLVLGRGVSVGHNAVLHGCLIEDDVLIGMHATIMDRAVIGTGSLIAAGALITEGTVIPPRSLVTGVPGKVRRTLGDAEVSGIRRNAATYLRHTALHASAQ